MNLISRQDNYIISYSCKSNNKLWRFTMKKPFTEFKCDVCGKTTRAEDAMLQWLQRKKDDSNPFPMILEDIHICCNRKPCDELYELRARYEDLYEQWDHLESFIGPDNLDELLTFPVERIIPQEKKIDFLEIMRRLTIPHYEEARQFFPNVEHDYYIDNLRDYEDGHASWRQQTLKNIIEKYADADKEK